MRVMQGDREVEIPREVEAEGGAAVEAYLEAAAAPKPARGGGRNKGDADEASEE